MSDLYEFEAQYEVHSCWELDFNIKDVYAWWVKYDTLYVIHKKEGDTRMYTPTFPARNTDFKHAVDYYQNSAPVEEKTLFSTVEG